ncbi:response regulator [Synechococcales cyanobacterium C]|uniref:Circadian input-output histidine kinase CikA n=1 Tax=Petrachloros mirabilis ULC683 TaxID=2781853 RepID=A0A8K2A0R6_9CYAN|nr:ATP-binding protein [Petrachloros mirabilis]NCJ07478.1 response regulator [Petrachloros mirabilis ULC683]
MDEKLHILIVDDDIVDRMAIGRALRNTGLSISLVEATDCADAIKTLQEQSFDCAFLDYRLPDQDGLDLIRQLDELGIRVPLIVLTGQGDEQLAVEIMKAGASDYLAKSKVTPERLSQVLQNAVRLSRAERAAELANQQLRTTNEQLLRQNQELESQRQQIECQNKKLIEASKLKSQFLATISHELRTPMNAIMGFSQLLREQYPDPLTAQQLDMVSRILNNSQNLLVMLNEVLDFSKIEAGHLNLRVSDFDLVKLVQLTAEELRVLAIQKSLFLDLDIRLQNPEVHTDQDCIRRILMNLIGNGIKFTETGGVRITVQALENDTLEIGVQDTGVGIPSDYLTAIFQPFRQADQTLTRLHPGTGLGLAITKSLVEAIQGSITVDSQVNQGSTFWVQFPRRVSPP